MQLTPIVCLISDADADTLRPSIAALAHNFDNPDVPIDTQHLMVRNGWTPEMLAWSLVFRGIAAGVRDGTIILTVTPSDTTQPDTDDNPD